MESTLPVQVMIQKRYAIEDELATGKSGSVYLVRQRQQKTLFVLKEIVSPVQGEQSRLHFESLTKLHHPALPFVYQIFDNVEQDRIYILMDFIEGTNLEELRQMQPEQRFSLSEVMTIMAPIVSTVIYLHDQNPPIIHENIKPSNIINSNTQNSSVLVGFRPKTEYDPEETITIIPHEASSYKAPEQYNGVITPQTDIYALGATFYTLLTGTTPINAFSRLKKLATEQSDPFVPLDQLNSIIPTPVGSAIRRAMSLNNKESFSTVEQFWTALKPFSNFITDEQQPTEYLAASSIDYLAAPSIKYLAISSLYEPGFFIKHRVALLTLLAVFVTLLGSLAVGVSLWSYVVGH